MEDFESLDEESAISANKRIKQTVDLLTGKKPEQQNTNNNAKSAASDESSSSKSSSSSTQPPQQKIYTLDLGPVKIPVDLGPLEQVGKVSVNIFCFYQ